MKLGFIKKAASAACALSIVSAAVPAVFAATLPAPEVEPGYTRYEAEEAQWTDGAGKGQMKPEYQAGQSGAGVDYNGKKCNVIGGLYTMSANSLNYDFSNTTNVKFEVDREESGVVEIVLGFRSSQEANFDSKCGNIPVKCNDGSVKEFVVSTQDGEETPKKQASVKVDMKAGKNYIYVAGPVTGGGWINLDYIDVSDVTEDGTVEPIPEEAEPMKVNPLVKTIYSADPSAHVWETDPDTLYVYPSHDRYPNRGCDRMDGFHVYSTKDMVNFKDEGEIFSAYDLEWGMTTENDATFMWAPDAAYKNGKYYFYYPRPAEDAWNSTWAVGVAVSDYPDHGFVDVGIPIAGIGGKGMIDPCVFTDPKTGDSYLILGGGGQCCVAKLNDDMVTLAEEPHNMYIEGEDQSEPNVIKTSSIPDYHEGPFEFYNEETGLYYLQYADNYVRKNEETGKDDPHNRQRYVYSESPTGPWKVPNAETAPESRSKETQVNDNIKYNGPEYGVMLDPVESDTSHGSAVKFKGQWYIFYHSKQLSESGALRSINADKLEFTANGQFKVAEQTDGSGLLVGEPDTDGEPNAVYQAEDAELGGGAGVSEYTYNGDRYTVAEGIQNSGAYITFNNVDGGNGGRTNIKFKYASSKRGYVKLTVNGRDYSYINMMNTGSNKFFNDNGVSNITVMLNPGTDNVITLSDANALISLDYMEVRHLD